MVSRLKQFKILRKKESKGKKGLELEFYKHKSRFLLKFWERRQSLLRGHVATNLNICCTVFQDVIFMFLGEFQIHIEKF